MQAGGEDTVTPSEDGFEFRGINHLALVCRDMERTVDFYTGVLGMPLVKTIELPAGMGQHFFFDCGGATHWPSSGSRTPRRPLPGCRHRREGPTRGA